MYIYRYVISLSEFIDLLYFTNNGYPALEITSNLKQGLEYMFLLLNKVIPITINLLFDVLVACIRYYKEKMCNI